MIKQKINETEIHKLAEIFLINNILYLNTLSSKATKELGEDR